MIKKMLIVSGFVFLGALTVYAQAPATSPVQVTEQTIATVNIANATTTSQQDHTFSIAFDLTNRIGVQPDVHYGVSLIQISNGVSSVADEKVYDESITLYENTVQHKVIAYQAPESLSGAYTLMLSVKNSRGVPFATKRLSVVTLSKQNTEFVSINPSTCYLASFGGNAVHYSLSEIAGINETDAVAVTCTVQNSTKHAVTLVPQVAERVDDAYGDIVGNDSTTTVAVMVPANDTRSVTISLPRATIPNTYYAALYFQDQATKSETNKISVLYFIKGTGASIRTLLLDKDAYTAGETATVSFTWTLFSSATNVKLPTVVSAVVSLNNDDQQSCAPQVTQILSPNAQIVKVPLALAIDCRNPKVTVNLVDSNQKILDVQSFSIVSQMKPKPTSFTTVYIIVAASVLLLLGTLYLLWKRRVGSAGISLVILFSALSVFGGAPHAHADTATLVPYCGGAGTCQPGFAGIYVDYDLDKSAYNPGDTIGVSYYVSAYDYYPRDDSGFGSLTFTASVNSGSYGANAFPGSTPASSMYGLDGSGVAGIATSVSGTVHVYLSANYYYAYHPVLASLPYTIAAPECYWTQTNNFQPGSGSMYPGDPAMYFQYSPADPSKFNWSCTGTNGAYCSPGSSGFSGYVTCTLTAPPPPTPTVNIQFQ